MKYLFLAFNIFQWIAAGTLVFRSEDYGKDLSAALLMASLGFVLYLVFLVAGRKIKCVVIGKDKVIVAETPLNIQFEWADVRSIRAIPLVGVYKLRLNGRKNNVYFLPSQHNGHAVKALQEYIGKAQVAQTLAGQPVEEGYRRLAI